MRYAAHGAPGFALVLDGGCWLAVDGEDAVRLDRGDFVLLPATPAFEMSSRPGIAARPAEPSASAVHHGEPGVPDFRMLGGSFAIDRVNAPLLLGLLPRLVHLSATGGRTTRLARLVDLIAEECLADDRPGSGPVIDRLLEVMLIEALRGQAIGDAPAAPGLFAGLRDPALARAIRAMHADVAHGWTVTALARLAGMSRSAFAARFTATVGCAPIEYLARWRIALAKDALGRGAVPLERLAAEIGFDSASAFSTAFRRRVGCAPGGFARGVVP